MQASDEEKDQSQLMTVKFTNSYFTLLSLSQKTEMPSLICCPFLLFLWQSMLAIRSYDKSYGEQTSVA